MLLGAGEQTREAAFPHRCTAGCDAVLQSYLPVQRKVDRVFLFPQLFIWEGHSLALFLIYFKQMKEKSQKRHAQGEGVLCVLTVVLYILSNFL